MTNAGRIVVNRQRFFGHLETRIRMLNQGAREAG